MDVFLTKVTQQAMNYAIRSGITITAGYAIRQSTRLLKKIDGADGEELRRLQERLQSKIRIISPAIDMIELIAARGNTSLESAVSLTKNLRWDIQNLGQRLNKIASDEGLSGKGPLSSRNRARAEEGVKEIIKEIRALLNRIEDAVPLINLAITTSGVSLSTSLPQSVSPSRLLQASTFLTAGDTQYSIFPNQPVQVGTTFTLSVYLLFAGHVRPQDEEGVRNTTWKEAIHKARVKLRRVPMDTVLPDGASNHPQGNQFRENARSNEFAYELLIIEDLDDDRFHTADEDDAAKPGYFEGVPMAGIRETIPIHQISKIFYADTGKILNIGSDGENNNPVLLLKRDVNAIPPRRMMDRGETEQYDFGDSDSEAEREEREPVEANQKDDTQSQVDAQLFGEEKVWSEEADKSAQAWRFPPGLDLEWIAFEVYQEPEDSDSETEAEAEAEGEPSPANAQLNDKMTKLHLNSGRDSPTPSTTSQHPSMRLEQHEQSRSVVSNPIFDNIRTSLSLLETLLRLTSLQQFQQQSHLSITDELLNFFLEESSTTGAGGDEDHRQHVRAEARRKVGWDPYDESPLKRRGEEYQYNVNPEDQDAWPHSPGGQNHGYASTPQSMRLRSSSSRPVSRASPNPSRRGEGIGSLASPSPTTPPSLRGQRPEGRRNTELRRQIPARRSPRLEEDGSQARASTGDSEKGRGTSPGSNSRE